MLQRYPKSQPEKIDAAAEAEVATAKQVVNATRNLRSEMKIPPKDRITLFITGEPSVATTTSTLSLARVSDLRRVNELPASDSPVAIAGPHRLMPYIEIDPAAERTRLEKESKRLEGEIAKAKAANNTTSAVG